MEADPNISKPTLYYETVRIDMVPLLPNPLGRVLDVGCGAGASGGLLRAREPDALIGIELDPVAAARARESYDQVFVGSADEVLPAMSEPFDTILCYDVLEHMLDPWKVLGQLAALSPVGGRLHVSVPNARHLSLVIDIMLRGTFNYQSHGHRDDTHLRWFTPRDLETAVDHAGFEVCARSHPHFSPPRRMFDRLTRGRAAEFLAGQWQVLAMRKAELPGFDAP